MNLQPINPSNTKLIFRRDQKASIHFDSIRASIFFSKKLSALLELDDRSCVEFFNDNDNPQDWYLHKHKDGFPVKTRKGRSKEHSDLFYFLSSALVQKFFSSLGLINGNYSITFQIGCEPLSNPKSQILNLKSELFPIITAPIIQQYKSDLNN